MLGSDPGWAQQSHHVQTQREEDAQQAISLKGRNTYTSFTDMSSLRGKHRCSLVGGSCDTSEALHLTFPLCMTQPAAGLTELSV
ncbi:hypothetical protein INR49_000599 [Caranx melampygus]|nr:hypothetical protein INR49_000599 [Caranx melampygus]